VSVVHHTVFNTAIVLDGSDNFSFQVALPEGDTALLSWFVVPQSSVAAGAVLTFGSVGTSVDAYSGRTTFQANGNVANPPASNFSMTIALVSSDDEYVFATMNPVLNFVDENA